MRKFLSLVLALVMMMSLVTINAGAKEFSDDGDITYQEAVDVISTIKVVDGYAGGDFKPGNNLTRGAAAKIICNLILGPTTAAELHADTAPYRDVPVTSEFAGYIAYCQKEGIISGYADGSFRPAGTLTGYAFMKMLLGALGYDAEIEGYTGPNWSINVAKRAIGIGLNANLEKTFNGVDYVTRQEAALYAFNTLKADLVEYDQKITATVNGAEVTVGSSNARPQEWGSQQTRWNNIYDDDNVQFAEQYFNKLVLTEDMDVFGRPDREWKYDGEEIGAYIKTELLKKEYTTEVTGRDLYDLLGSRTIDEYNFEIHVDGEESKDVLNGNDNADVFHFTQGNMIRSNTKGIGGTGNGVLTQVFVDNDKDVETVYVAVVNTYLAIATDDYDEKKEEAEFEVYSLEDLDNTTAFVLVKNTSDVSRNKAHTVDDLRVKNEDITVEDVKDGDIVLVRVADGAIQEILDPEVISETEISAFKNGSWVKADEQYDYANSASYDPEVLDEYVKDNMKNTTYNLYLDPYGYMIGIEIVEATTNYAFLTGIDGKTSNLANKTAEGNIILTDGTMDTVTIKLNDSKYADGKPMTTTDADHSLNSLMNTWCKYTVNKSGAYVLTEIARTDTQFNADKNKAGQSRHIDVTSINNAGFDKYGTIDKKHVSTLGINEYTGVNNTANVKMAYGTDDSIYITVTTDLIRATRPNQIVDDNNPAIIIDDVDAVTVGVQNANLTAWTATQVFHNSSNTTGFTDTAQAGSAPYQPGRLDSIANGVYNLFDTDGAIIAAIVVGEDSGSTTNYAYVISDDMEQESYNKEDELWTWSRKVIVNGEITEITEVSDGATPDIDSMVLGQWYEMKYKGDGTVKSASLISWDENRDDSTTMSSSQPNGLNVVGEFWAKKDADTAGNKFVGLVRKVEASVEDNDTVVLSTDLTGTNATQGNGWISIPTGPDYLSLDPVTRGPEDGTNVITTTGNTLWIESAVANQKDGFAVRNDAKIVLVQDTHVLRDGAVVKTNVMENQYEYSQTGKEALAKMVKDLMDNEKFSGFISAVFEGGVATSVVVWDQTPDVINAGNETEKPVDPDLTTVHLQYIDANTGTQINVGKTVEKMAAGDKIIGDNLIGYICRTADRTVVVPTFQAGTTELTLTLWYDPIAGNAATSDDQGTYETPALKSVMDAVVVAPEDDTATTKPLTGITPVDEDSNEKLVSDDVTNDLKAEIVAQGPGIYHHTQAMQNLLGWTHQAGESSFLQIGKDQDVNTAVLLVTINLPTDTGYSLILDNTVEVATGLWATGGVQCINWDEIPVGIHTYKIVNTAGDIVQAGTFTMTASNA